MAVERLPRGALDEHVCQSLGHARTRSERYYCWARIAFCGAVLARFLLIRAQEPEGMGGPGTLTNTLCIATLIGFSGWMLRRLRAEPVTMGLLLISVVVDALGCSASLLQDVLWPAQRRADDYTGLLAHPDVFAQLIMVMAAALRLSPVLVVLSGTLNLGLAVALIWVDWVRWDGFRGYVQEEISLYLLCMLTVAVLSALAATGFRHLLRGLSAAQWKIQCARTNFAVLASDHHDVKSVLSAALLHADLCQERVAHSTDDAPGAARIEDVQAELARLGGQLEGLCERAFAELTLLRPEEAVLLHRTVERAIGLLRQRFTTLDIELALAHVPTVLLPGGPSALERILYNLVSNARAGDGRRGARRVQVRTFVQAEAVCLRVEDDGPGFGVDAPCSLSSKRDGSGVGLQLIRQLVGASGGSVEFGRGDLGGACVTLRWRVAGRHQDQLRAWVGRLHATSSRG